MSEEHKHEHEHEHEHDHDHGHGHGHHHHHHLPEGATVGAGLIGGVALNALLVVAQVIAGVLSGSLALLADALHNFSDGASILIALIARKIAGKRADHRRTFGYRRAEIIGAMINLTTLIILGIYLVGRAIERFANPQEVGGEIVMIVAGSAVVLNGIITVLLMSGSKHSLNIRAAFIHSVADTVASVGVIVVGLVVYLFGWWWADPLATLVIAGYILYEGVLMIRQTIHILLQSVPEGLSIEDVAKEATSVDSVQGIHHLHVWQMDEHRRMMEAHVVIDPSDASRLEEIKDAVKHRLADKFKIHHATLEFELDQPSSPLPACDPSVLVPAH